MKALSATKFPTSNSTTPTATALVVASGGGRRGTRGGRRENDGRCGLNGRGALLRLDERGERVEAIRDGVPGSLWCSGLHHQQIEWLVDAPPFRLGVPFHFPEDARAVDGKFLVSG